MASHTMMIAKILCKLCGRVYLNPKLLACLHSFCANCLKDYHCRTNSKTILCPICQTQTNINQDVDGLTTNVFVQHQIQELGLSGVVHQSSQQKNRLSLCLDELESGPSVNDGNDQQRKSSPNNEILDKKSPVLLTNLGNNDNIMVKNRDERVSSSDVTRQSPQEMGTEKMWEHLQEHDDFQILDFSQQLNSGSPNGCLPKKERLTSLSRNIFIDENFDTLNDNLHKRFSDLQVKALKVTSAIDNLNQSVIEWKDNKRKIKNDIHYRAQHLQKAIRQIERKLVAEVENSEDFNEFMDEVTDTKSKLQDLLKLTLYNIDFLRQIIGDGTKNDILYLGNFILEHEVCNVPKGLTLRFPHYNLHVPSFENEGNLAENFGKLTKIWKRKTFLNSRKPPKTRSSYHISSSQSKFDEFDGLQFAHMSSPKADKQYKSYFDEMAAYGKYQPEANVYLKYEQEKRKLEQRRRELHIKQMMTNKSSLSQDEITLAEALSDPLPTCRESQDKETEEHKNKHVNEHPENCKVLSAPASPRGQHVSDKKQADAMANKANAVRDKISTLIEYQKKGPQLPLKADGGKIEKDSDFFPESNSDNSTISGKKFRQIRQTLKRKCDRWRSLSLS